MALKKSEISNEALEVLTRGEFRPSQQLGNKDFTGGVFYLPNYDSPAIRLEPKLYKEVNKILENFGGKWNRQLKGHHFSENPTSKINDAILTGNYTRLDKNGFFPTPAKLANSIVQKFQKPLYERFLEPNSGNGNLVKAFIENRRAKRFVLIEPNRDLLQKSWQLLTDFAFDYDFARKCENINFEDYSDTYSKGFDAIFMNPPFENGMDAEHISMAINLLAPGGELVAICSLGLRFRQDSKYRILREFLETNAGDITDNDDGAFKESGTNVRTVTIYYKNESGEKIKMKKSTKKGKSEETETKDETEMQTTDETQTAKPNTKKSAGSGKGAGGKGKKSKAAGKPENTAQTVLRVASTGGEIQEIERAEAVSDLRSKWTDETIDEMLNNGEVVMSDDFVYATNRQKLEKALANLGVSDASAEPVEETETAPVEDLEYQIDPEFQETEVAESVNEFESETVEEHSDESAESADGAQSPEESAETAEIASNEPETTSEQSPEPETFTDFAAEQHETLLEMSKGFKHGATVSLKEGGQMHIRIYKNAKGSKAEEAYILRDGSTLTGNKVLNDKEFGGTVENSAVEIEDYLTWGVAANVPQVGDKVIDTEHNRFGEVYEKNGLRSVRFERDGKPKTQVLSGNWRKLTGDEITALEKVDAPIQGEVVPAMDTPLSDEEKVRFEELKQIVRESKGTLDSTIQTEKKKMSAALHEIRAQNLFRETHKEFGKFIVDEFGITREYGQSLAAIGGYLEVVGETLALSPGVELSINAASELVKDTNKLTKSLGIGKVEFEVAKPVITNTLRLLIDTAPKEKDGITPILTPRVVDKFNDVLESHIKDGVIEIDGRQYTLEEAQKQGLLNQSLRMEVLEAAAESIRVNTETIRTEVAVAYGRQNEPVKISGNPSQSQETYTGKVPTFTFGCSKHQVTKMKSIGNGRVQFACECRGMIDADSGEFVIFEVEGKKVKR